MKTYYVFGSLEEALEALSTGLIGPHQYVFYYGKSAEEYKKRNTYIEHPVYILNLEVPKDRILEVREKAGMFYVQGPIPPEWFSLEEE